MDAERRAALDRLGPCPFVIGDRVEAESIMLHRRLVGVVVAVEPRECFLEDGRGRGGVWDAGFVGFDGWLVKVREDDGNVEGWIDVRWLSWPSTVDMVA